MASHENGVSPVDDTVVVIPEDQPTQSDDEWPVSELYRVEPAEDDPTAEETVPPAADTPTVLAGAPVAAAPAAPDPARRRFPPDVGPGLPLAIAGAIAAMALVAVLLNLRNDSAATARDAPQTGTTTSTSAAAPPAPTAPPETGTQRVALADLTGMSLAKARSLLEGEGLRVKVSRLQSGRPGDEVLTQQPAAGEKIAEGGLVTLVASQGETTPPASSEVGVPGVVGLSASAALRAVRDAGLEARMRRVTSSQPPGTVIDQSPAAGTQVEEDSVVELDVAKARPAPVRVDVPDVVGSTAGEARSALRSAGLTVTVVEVESDDPAGTVVSQSPRAGAQVRKDSDVTLRVSSGPAEVDVPDVTGLDEGSATAQLESAGFEVRVTDESTTDPSQDGLVLRQSPQSGSSAAKGALVTLTVGRLG